MVLLEAFDESLAGALGSTVLNALYATLLKDYDIARDQLPYRLDTVFMVIREIFGLQGAATLGRAVMRRLYRKLNLEFDEDAHYPLDVHIYVAKRKLANP